MAANYSTSKHPIQVFVSYAHADEILCDKLAKHLSLLQHQKVISTWHDRQIPPGTEWADKIDIHLERAQLILLLISADFIASKYCYGVEMTRAMERHDSGEACIIPVILRDVDWHSAPFGKLQALPKDGHPITSWPNCDEAFADVVRGIRAMALELSAHSSIIQDRIVIGSASVLGPELVRIPAGNYSPESEQGHQPKESGYHVYIDEFAIGKHPITFREYDLFCDTSGYDKPYDRGWGREDRPVINVTFSEVQNYVDWLCQQTGKEYRLPTEAEWEYAARSGTETTYWWGNEIRQNEQVWSNCDGCGSSWDKKQTSPVGSFPANPWGLHDTAGNVWEWTSSVYAANYDDQEIQDINPSDTSPRVIRGGSWFDPPKSLRSTHRYSYPIHNKTATIGFRVARSL